MANLKAESQMAVLMGVMAIMVGVAVPGFSRRGGEDIEKADPG